MAGALSNGVAIGGNVARLTGYIRAFGDVSFKYELGEKKEKDLPLGEDQKSGIKWEDIQSILEEHNKRDLAADLRKFRNQVLDMVGSDANKDHIDETCLDLVQMFAGQKNVTMEQFRDLKRRNGNITQSSLEKIHRVVKDLTVDMSEDTKNKIKGSEGSSDEDTFFGSSIKFTGFEDVDLSYLQDFTQPEFSLQKELTFNLDFVTAQQEALNKASAGDSIDTGWLENTIRNCYGDEQPVGMSVQEFCLTILDMLSSKRSAEELQTELFDLCGFVRFEMITSLLEHKKL